MSFHLSEEHIDEPPIPRAEGGRTAEYTPEDIHDTGTGITGTASRIRSVSQDVGNISIDSKSFGALNGEFAAAAQDHVRTAQQHVESTANEVDAAADATHSTANNVQATEQVNTKRFTAIGDAGEPEPTPHPSAGSGGASGGATGGPPAAPPDPPALPPSGGDAPPGGPPATGPGSSPVRPSWRGVINDPANFTPDERASINDALHKMAQEPEPGRVAGSGTLTPDQQQLVARVQKMVTIEPDTPMQKAMPQGSANDYLGNVTRTRAVDGWDSTRTGWPASWRDSRTRPTCAPTATSSRATGWATRARGSTWPTRASRCT